MVNEKGVMVFKNRDLLDRHLQALVNKEFELIIREKSKDVTPNQLNYYFGGILKVAYNTEMFGHYNKSADLHDKVFAPMFLQDYRVIKRDGRDVLKKECVSLTKLTSAEMAVFIERVIAFLDMEGITVMKPEQFYK